MSIKHFLFDISVLTVLFQCFAFVIDQDSSLVKLLYFFCSMPLTFTNFDEVEHIFTH